MPVLATQNIKDEGIFNTVEFVIEGVKRDKIKIKDKIKRNNRITV